MVAKKKKTISKSQKSTKSSQKPSVTSYSPANSATPTPSTTPAIPNPSNINDPFWNETREDLEQSAKNPFGDILKKNQMEMQRAKKNQKIIWVLLAIVLLALIGLFFWVVF